MQKNAWKEWFIFSKRERNGGIILLLLIAVTLVLPYFFSSGDAGIHLNKELQAEINRYDSEQPSNKLAFYAGASDTSIADTARTELFYFDPNTLPEEGFLRLGLSGKVAHTIVNYRNKGGHFKNAEDIRKIYGLPPAQAGKLIPYIRIDKQANAMQQQEAVYRQPFPEVQSKQYKKININSATAEDWKAFPGIGEVIGNRIIKFRTSMGGFKSVDQVAKTYGLSDSVFQQIKPYLFLKDSTNN